MKVVIDTGPLLAFVARREPAHELTERLLTGRDLDLLIPDPVLAEADYLVRERVSVQAGRALLEDVRRGNFRRIPIDDWLFERALKYDRDFGDLDLGFVDGSVMALAERERAHIFTFDFADFRATRPLRGGFWRLAVQESDLEGL